MIQGLTTATRIYFLKVNFLISFIDPDVIGRSPVAKILLREPEFNFMIGRLNSIWAVANVSSNLKSK